MSDNIIEIKSGELNRHSGTEYPTMNELDPDRVIVSMLEFKGNVYVATQKRVYILANNKLQRIEFKELKA